MRALLWPDDVFGTRGTHNTVVGLPGWLGPGFPFAPSMGKGVLGVGAEPEPAGHETISPTLNTQLSING